MSRFSILQFGDAHVDQGNLDLTLPALEAIADYAEKSRPDLSVFTGDGFVRRGHLHPEPIYRFRVALERVAAASRFGLIVVDGNHDLLFDGSVSSLFGAIVGRRAPQSESLSIVVASQPQIFVVGAEPNAGAISAVVVAVPTVDRLRLGQYAEKLTAEGGGGDWPGFPGMAEAEAVELAIRSLIAEAMEKAAPAGAPLIVVYHGSLSGATLGNEQTLRAGIDVPIRASAFTGADLVCLGHIHKAQQIPGSVPIWYNGPIAPLTWGEESVKPVMLEHVVSGVGDGFMVETKLQSIPVSYQMLEASVEFVSSDNPLADLVALISGGSLFPADAELGGARVRLTVRGPRSVLALLKSEDVEGYLLAGGVRDVTIIRDVRDEETARIQTEDRKINLFDAVALWYRLRPEDLRSEEEEARLLALAAEIEGLVRDDELDARFDFRPLFLTVQNWAQFQSAEIDFSKLNGIVAVRGANTAGKSNLVRAIPFALFKTQEAGDVLSDLIRHGAEAAVVSLVFASHRCLYRITRKLRRGKSRGASQILILESYRPNEGEAFDLATIPWQICNEGDEAATQRKIEALVGTREIFEGTVYAGQDSVSSLLALRPAEMKDLLGTVLHRDFAGRTKIVAERRLKAEREIEKLRSILAVSDEDDRKKEKLEETVASCLRRIAEIEEELASSEVDTGAAMLDELSAERVRLATEVSVSVDLSDRIDDAQRRRSGLESTAADLRVAMKKADEARLKISALPAVTVASEAEIERMSSRAAELRQEAEKIRTAAKESGDALMKKREEAITLAREAAAKFSALGKELEQIRRDRELLGSIPCRGEVWRDYGKTAEGVLVDLGTCQFVGDARSRAGREAEVSAELDAAEAKRSELALEASNIWESVKKGQQETDEKLAPLVREAAALGTEVSDALRARSKAAEAATRRQELEVLLAKWTAIAGPDPVGAVAKLEADMTSLEISIDDLSGKISALEPKKARIAEIEQIVSRIKLAREAAEATKKGLALAMSDLSEQKARAEGAIAQIESNSADVLERRAALEREGAAVRIFTLYEQACGRDGVPFLLLERFAIPAISAAVNRYLEPTGFRVEVESDRVSVTAGTKSGVFFFFSDSRGRHPVSSSSGFQTDSIGSALRNAVADLHADATGTTLRCAIQDEGFGSYDAANIVAARETIRRIAAERELFILVSHVGGLSEIADWVIDVVPRDGRSEIQITRGS